MLNGLWGSGPLRIQTPDSEPLEIPIAEILGTTKERRAFIDGNSNSVSNLISILRRALSARALLVSMASNTWSFGPSLPAAVEASAGVVLNGKFYVIGGDDFTNAVSTNYIYDIAGNSWSTGTALPAARQSRTRSSVSEEYDQ